MTSTNSDLTILHFNKNSYLHITLTIQIIRHSGNVAALAQPIIHGVSKENTQIPSINFPLNITRCSSLKFVNSSADEKLISRDTALDFSIFFGTRAGYKDSDHVSNTGSYTFMYHTWHWPKMYYTLLITPHVILLTCQCCLARIFFHFLNLSNSSSFYV